MINKRFIIFLSDFFQTHKPFAVLEKEITGGKLVVFVLW